MLTELGTQTRNETIARTPLLLPSSAGPGDFVRIVCSWMYSGLVCWAAQAEVPQPVRFLSGPLSDANRLARGPTAGPTSCMAKLNGIDIACRPRNSSGSHSTSRRLVAAAPKPGADGFTAIPSAVQTMRRGDQSTPIGGDGWVSVVAKALGAVLSMFVRVSYPGRVELQSTVGTCAINTGRIVRSHCRKDGRCDIH